MNEVLAAIAVISKAALAIIGVVLMTCACLTSSCESESRLLLWAILFLLISK